jgi:MFS family permease
VANFLVIDRPPDATAPAPHAAAGAHGAPAAPAENAITLGQLLKTPAFWAVTLAAIAPTTGAVILTANMVPMAASWGLTAAQGATLLSMQSLVGIAGTLIFGWVADRLGGVRALALLAFGATILWALLYLLPPSFVVLAGLIGVAGLLGAGSLPVNGAALSELFGRESFSRVYGIFNLVNLPFGVACVPISAMIFQRTGSYAGAILAQAIFFAIAIALASFARAHPPQTQTA